MTDEQKTVLAQLVKIAVDRKVDAVLIAGDIYDRAVPPTEAVNLLDNTLKELVMVHNIPVILIAGNHVAELQERIPTRLEVTPGQQGSTAKFYI